MDGLCMETPEGVAAAIRENRVGNLLDVDWEKVIVRRLRTIVQVQEFEPGGFADCL